MIRDKIPLRSNKVKVISPYLIHLIHLIVPNIGDYKSLVPQDFPLLGRSSWRRLLACSPRIERVCRDPTRTTAALNATTSDCPYSQTLTRSTAVRRGALHISTLPTPEVTAITICR
jgi:hypothetical protein